MSTKDDAKMPKFMGIVGHDNVSHNGSKTTVYHLQVQVDNAMFVVHHRYHEFKDFHDRLTADGFKCPALPPKKFLGSFNKEFIEKRQQELTFWLHLLCSWDPSSPFPDPRRSEHYRDFLLANKQPLDREKYDTTSTASTASSSASATGGNEPVPEAPTNSGGTEALYNTPKTSLDDFELLKVIGKGSYGKVTLVRKKESKKLFAMKSLNKSNVKRRNQVEHTKTERRVLGRAKHPFIVHLHYAFQTSQKLYFVLDYCPGGELFFHLSRMEKFEEPMAKFYAAEITLALEHLHELGVVYRDLKPENILFDDKGHVLLADFGLAKEGITDGAEGTNSMCGTPEYLPPEILDRTGHGTAVDWWALGMVLYEMLTGLPPWYTRNRQELFARIREAPLEIPKYLSQDAASLIALLLHRDPEKRLGSRGAAEVKAHRYFRTVDWDGLLWADPPFKPSDPQAKEAGDTSNFDKEFTELPVSGTPMSKMTPGSEVPRNMFAGFTFEAPTMSFGSDTSQSKVDVASTPFI